MSGMWPKAVAASKSARVLLAQDDFDGASNRAYFAVFCAARASLRFVNPKLDMAKTHTGVIRQFGQQLVLCKGLDPRLGRLLSQMEAIRSAADYEDEPLSKAATVAVLADMEWFLSEISRFIGTTHA